jgi:hypothetical protein
VSIEERKCKKTFLSTEAGNYGIWHCFLIIDIPFLYLWIGEETVFKTLYIVFIQTVDTVLRKYGNTIQEFKWNHMKTQVQVEVSLVLFICSGY